jgi:hypothetical protein
MGQVESENNAMSVRIVNRRALAREVRQDDQACAGRRSFSFGAEGSHGRSRIEFASELFAKRVAQGSTRGEAGGCCLLAGKEPWGVPKSANRGRGQQSVR